MSIFCFTLHPFSKMTLNNQMIKQQEELQIKTSQHFADELHESHDELIRDEKLAFTGRIAASIAHEIRNPLTNILMSLREVLRHVDIKKTHVKYLEIAVRNANRIDGLITELLNCARPLELNLQPCDIHDIIKEILLANRTMMRLQHIKVIKKFSSHLSVVYIDRKQIMRVISNLIRNAIESMSKNGGSLIISTEVNNGSFFVRIEDTGIGISSDNIIKIFDPFFSDKTGGIGLGLTICYGIIVSHNGSIEVQSEFKKGSVFTIKLPVRQEESQINIPVSPDVLSSTNDLASS